VIGDGYSAPRVEKVELQKTARLNMTQNRL
jgi:hypothetical protein